MKESTLVRKMKNVGLHLRNTKLVDNCYRLAEEKGEGNRTVHSAHTNINYMYDDGTLKIDLDDGQTMFGEGTIEVFYHKKLVLHGDRNAAYNDENKYNPKVSDFCILTYNQGKWEQEVVKRLKTKKKTKKETQPKDPDIDTKTLSRLKTNFSSLAR